jgi:hypothetical protein
MLSKAAKGKAALLSARPIEDSTFLLETNRLPIHSDLAKKDNSQISESPERIFLVDIHLFIALLFPIRNIRNQATLLSCCMILYFYFYCLTSS